MEKTKIYTIKEIKKNPKFLEIIDLLRIIRKYNVKGLELKEIKAFFDIKHDILLKKALGNAESRLPRDIKKEISKELRILTNFNSKQDIFNCLKRLKPYIKSKNRKKASKYYLTITPLNFYDIERLKYAVFEILNSNKKADILNIDTFQKDKVVKIDIDGISISIPIEKLDFT